MKPLLYLAALWLSALTFAAISRSATERPDLEARLPVHQPVFCGDSTTEWDDTAPFGAVAYTWMTGPQQHQIFLSPTTCLNLADSDRKPFADAAETLYHEWFHSNFGMRDEGDVECHALFILRYVLRHYWGFTPPQAQAAYRRAFQAHILLGLFAPQYMGDCRYPQPDPA